MSSTKANHLFQSANKRNPALSGRPPFTNHSTAARHPATRALCTFIWILFVSLHAACANQTTDLQTIPALETARSAHAQPADLDAAISYAIQACDMAVRRVQSVHARDDARLYTLITANQEPGWLLIEDLLPHDPLDPDAEHRQPDTIRASARIGRFGDPEREDELLRRLEERLVQLRRGPSRIDWDAIVNTRFEKPEDAATILESNP